MSDSKQCDLCGALYIPSLRTVSIKEISVKTKTEIWHTWSDVDYCPACSEKLLHLIGKSFSGLPKKI
jgi:hypothetical protein